MKILAVLFALVTLASGFKIGTKKAQLIKLAKSNQCEPDETECPFGCCPEANWYCCPGGVFCAVDAEDCPSFEAKKTQLVELAKSKSSQCDSDETSCPAGCCSEANWYCCPDDSYCAATAADCPFETEKTQLLVKLAKKSSQQWCDGPDETYCPNGFCCPEDNWLCCPDDWCAPTLADCP